MGLLDIIDSALRAIETPYSFVYGLIFGRGIKYKETLSIAQNELPTSHHKEITLQSLPPELLLHIFSFLELKPYIISRAVCKDWQRLLPLADIHPIRRRLFNLFLHMLEYPRFAETRSWTIKHLQLFDRQAYVNSLLSQYPAIPDEFRMWILEWPGRMAISCMWPGLPLVKFRGATVERNTGVNWMSYGSPMLLSIGYKEGTSKPRFIPALLVWKTGYATCWLIFENNITGLFGRVLMTRVYEDEAAAIYPIPIPSDPDSDNDSEDGSDDVEINLPSPDWITFLEDRWDSMLDISTDRADSFEPVLFPVEYKFNASLSTLLPSPPWVNCHASGFQHELLNSPYLAAFQD